MAPQDIPLHLKATTRIPHTRGNHRLQPSQAPMGGDHLESLKEATSGHLLMEEIHLLVPHRQVRMVILEVFLLRLHGMAIQEPTRSLETSAPCAPATRSWREAFVSLTWTRGPHNGYPNSSELGVRRARACSGPLAATSCVYLALPSFCSGC